MSTQEWAWSATATGGPSQVAVKDSHFTVTRNYAELRAGVEYETSSRKTLTANDRVGSSGTKRVFYSAGKSTLIGKMTCTCRQEAAVNLQVEKTVKRETKVGRREGVTAISHSRLYIAQTSF